MTARHSAAPHHGDRWRFVAPAIVLVVATSIAFWSLGTYLVGVFHDDGVYALLAQSIASGNGFHYSFLPGAPAATHYPPLYPLLLSLFWALAPSFPDNVPSLLGLNAAMVGGAALGWWHFATRRGEWNRWVAIAGALAASLTMPTLVLANALLSETMFLAMLWPCLLLCEGVAEATAGAGPSLHSGRQNQRNDAAPFLPSSNRRLIWTGVAIGALMLVRTHALALLGAMVVMMAIHRRWREGAIVGASAIGVQLPWILWTAFASPHVTRPLEGSYGSYVGWFVTGVRDGGASFVLATVKMNATECWLFVGDRLAAGFPPLLQVLATTMVVVALIVGCWSLRRRAPVTLLFACFYFAIVLVWPYNPWRFLWAVWPLLGLLVFSGVRWAWSSAGRWRVGVAVAAVLPAVIILRVELHVYATRDWRSPARDGARTVTPVLAWVHRNVTPEQPILSDGEQVLALYLGQVAAPPVSFTAREYVAPLTLDEGRARLTAMLDAVPARYVILTAPGLQQSADALAPSHPGLRRVQSLQGTGVYEVVP
ncbi:MAG: hypothetical protein V4550_12580 [Gemmatimonadota bacterium]